MSRKKSIEHVLNLSIAVMRIGFAVGLASLMLAMTAPASNAERSIVVVDISGVIGIATTLHVEKAIDEARRRNADVLIIRVDTPGGLLTSTREIVQLILNSPTPIVGYVAPSGAHAASAGTFIVAATHIAAMAPGTQIGAATPVMLTPPLPNGRPAGDNEEKDNVGAAADREAMNDTVAFVRSLGQMRGRNVEWLEKAVRDAATLTAEDAVREKVVELVAADINDLLRQLDGREVRFAEGMRKLATKGATVTTIEMDWRMLLLSAIADPTVAFILLMIGIYGIMFEFWNPGAIAPGVIGGICLILALTALTSLPLNFGGLALLLLGLGLMTAEGFAPGFGIMGIGGIAAFIVGALFLFDPEAADVNLQIALPVIIGAALTSAALMMFIVGFAVQAHRRAVVIGGDSELVGLQGEIVAWQDLEGAVRVHGEVWSARSDRRFAPGDLVRVKAREGLVLTVEGF